jgi:hypothetical protein
MLTGWTEKRVLVIVRTYPAPARRGIEVSCTAGITDDGRWIRLFPIPYRFLDQDRRFRKYQWITVDVFKAKDDPRPESFKLNIDSIRVGDIVPPSNGWRERREIIRPLMRPSLCGIRREREEHGAPTLGVFKPAVINRLLIEPTDPNWTPAQLNRLRQTPLFQKAPAQILEKLPHTFKYEFTCADAACGGHQMTRLDWEMGQSYRRWRSEYKDGWIEAFRLRYEHEMINKYDTHLFVGNMHQHQNSWIVVGLFYPPPQQIGDLFS